MPISREFRSLFRLAGPIIASNLGMMAMAAVDNIFLGRVSATALAASALGHSFVHLVSFFGIGCLHGLDPILAQAEGAGDRKGLALGFQRGLVLAALLCLPTCLLLLPAGPLFRLLGQPEALASEAADFALLLIPGVPAWFFYMSLTRLLQARHRTRFLLSVSVLGNLANALLDFMWIRGLFGFPAMGAEGCALATSAVRILMALALLRLARREVLPCLRPWNRRSFDSSALRRLFRLCRPIGFQLVAEIGGFASILVFMGWIGTDEVAGHQIALHLASITFMVPLGIGGAAAARVGHAIGRGEMEAARLRAGVALLAGVGFMGLAAALFLLLPETLARIFSDQEGAVGVARRLLPLAGAFQVFDGLQVVSGGILRGSGDTRTPMRIHLLGFWLCGIPAALLLGFPLGLGPEGLWLGLVLALFLIALLLLRTLRRRLGSEIPRLASLDAGSEHEEEVLAESRN